MNWKLQWKTNWFKNRWKIFDLIISTITDFHGYFTVIFSELARNKNIILNNNKQLLVHDFIRKRLQPQNKHFLRVENYQPS